MRRHITGLRAWALMAPGLAGGGHAACTVSSVDMPVKMVGSRPIATAGINGTPTTLLVDSGAVFSMLMRSTATELNLPLRRLPFAIYGVNGRIPDARMTTVEHLKLLDGDLPGIDFMVAGNEIGETAMGVIGRDILGAVDTGYDLAHGVVRFVRPGAGCDDANMAYWAGDTPVSELELMAFNVEANDMLIGVDFFLSHRIYVSRKRHLMFFTYNGGAVFAQNHGVPAAVADAASAADTLGADEFARRGAAWLSRNELPAALADLDRACAMAPDNASYRVTRASDHARMKQRALAIADLDAALRLAPTDARALVMRAQQHAPITPTRPRSPTSTRPTSSCPRRPTSARTSP